MPASTPNTSYPYPLGGDPIDVAGDVKKLAEAVDIFDSTHPIVSFGGGPPGNPLAAQRLQICSHTGVWATNAGANTHVDFPKPFASGGPIVVLAGPSLWSAGQIVMVDSNSITTVGFNMAVVDHTGAGVANTGVGVAYIAIGAGTL